MCQKGDKMSSVSNTLLRAFHQGQKAPARPCYISRIPSLPFFSAKLREGHAAKAESPFSNTGKGERRNITLPVWFRPLLLSFSGVCRRPRWFEFSLSPSSSSFSVPRKKRPKQREKCGAYTSSIPPPFPLFSSAFTIPLDRQVPSPSFMIFLPNLILNVRNFMKTAEWKMCALTVVLQWNVTWQKVPNSEVCSSQSWPIGNSRNFSSSSNNNNNGNWTFSQP